MNSPLKKIALLLFCLFSFNVCANEVDDWLNKGDISDLTKDYKQAIKWYSKAAEQGYAPAQYNLGIMYREGEGTPQDYKQAIKWNTKAD